MSPLLAWLFFTCLFWLFLCVAVLALVVWLVWVAPRRPSPEEAEELLRRRYIDGEIDEDEYERGLEEIRRPVEQQNQ